MWDATSSVVVSMPGQGRLGDKATVSLDAHGCLACPHPGSGPAIQGSPDVNVNKRPALRVDDPGIHAACCGANTWTATMGSATVFINGKGAHRMGDQNRHCGGMGQLAEGSTNVMVGEATAAGARAAGPATRAASSNAAGTQTSAAAAPAGTAAGSANAAAAVAASGAAGEATPVAAGAAATAIGAAATGAAPTGDGADGAPATGAAASAQPGASGAPPHSSPASWNPASAAPPRPDADPSAWIEIALIAEDGKGVAGARYAVTMPDGEVRTGALNGDGRAKLVGAQAGVCDVRFPDLDSDAWEFANGA